MWITFDIRRALSLDSPKTIGHTYDWGIPVPIPKYSGITLGLEARKRIGTTYIYRVRRGNGYYGSILGRRYQDRYTYVVPSSINNAEGQQARDTLAAAVLAWQGLPETEKNEWRAKERSYPGKTGYSLFIRDFFWRYHPVSVDVGEGHIHILPTSYDSVGQGPFVLHPDEMYYAGGYLLGNGVNGDNLTYKVYLAAGTYTLLYMATKQNSAGIIDVDIDAVEVASFDCYAAALERNYDAKQVGITISTAGLKSLKLRVDGKNASSSAYYTWIRGVALWRTA